MASIEPRRIAGRIIYRVRFRHDGKNKAEPFDNLQQAQKWKTLVELNPLAALAALDSDTGEPPRTVAEQVAHHVAHLSGVTEGTTRSYTAILTRDIAPTIGHLPLQSLTRDHVSGWVRDMEARGDAGKTIRNRLSVLSAALASAVHDGLLEVNVVKDGRIRIARTVREEMVFLTDTEFARMLPLIHAHYRPLVLFLVGTGVRFGEATALHVADVDLSGSARIRMAWKRTGKSVRQLGPTKTGRSTRTIAVPEPVLQAMRPLVHDRPAGSLVFTSMRGEAIRQSTFWKNTWKPAVHEFAGDDWRRERDPATGRYRVVIDQPGTGKRPRIHDLRHTFASWHISEGTPLPVIQRQLGHESITTTIDTYGHLARSDFDALAAATARRLPSLAAPVTGAVVGELVEHTSSARPPLVPVDCADVDPGIARPVLDRL